MYVRKGGGFGDVLGPLVQMLSHSSVEYSGAASRDRQDGRRYRKKKHCRRSNTRRRQSGERAERRVFFHFSEGTPDIIKESADWVTPNQTLTTFQRTLPLHSLCTLRRGGVNISISSIRRLIPWKDEEKERFKALFPLLLWAQHSQASIQARRRGFPPPPEFININYGGEIGQKKLAF